jgi:AbrB family looped-hinge helix DNA binding protein
MPPLPSNMAARRPCMLAYMSISYLRLTLQNTAMAMKKLTTIVSTKGQVILPKAVREHHRWPAGTQLLVVDTPEGVMLRPAPHFAPSRPKDVFKSLAYQGPPKTLEDLKAGIATEARRRHARNRY